MSNVGNAKIHLFCFTWALKRLFTRSRSIFERRCRHYGDSCLRNVYNNAGRSAPAGSRCLPSPIPVPEELATLHPMCLCISTFFPMPVLLPHQSWGGVGWGSAWPGQVRVGTLGAPIHFQRTLSETIDLGMQRVSGSSVPGTNGPSMGWVSPLGWGGCASPVSWPGKLQAEKAGLPNSSPLSALLRWKQQLKTTAIERLFCPKRQEVGG